MPPEDSPVGHLVAEYERIRADRPSGRRRTSMMTELCGRLIVETVADGSFDPVTALRSGQPGWRLAGYASAYGRPRDELLEPACDALAAEQVPFNRYWAARAVGRIVDRRDPRLAVPPRVLATLTDLHRRLGRHTDEWYELDAVLAGLRDRPAPTPPGDIPTR